MVFYMRYGGVPTILTAFFIAVTLVELVFTVPVPVEPNNNNARALRSVSSSHRRNAWNENNPASNLLLSQQQRQQQQQTNDTVDPTLAGREKQTGDGTSYAEDDEGDGSSEVELDGDGTFINDTQAGSRLKPNSTEPCSLEPAILCSSSDPPHSNRDKQRRIAHIVNYLWTNVFGNRTSPVNKDSMRERFNPVNPSSSSFSGGLDSIAASCDLPSDVESEAWSSERYFSMFFNLTSKYPDILGSLQNSAENSSSEAQQQQQQLRDGESVESGHSQEYLPVSESRSFLTTLTVTPVKSVNVISAKLRLYKIGTSENSNNIPPIADIIERVSEPCNDTDVTSYEEVVPSVLPITTRVTFPEFSPSADEKIRVSVFWYTQPATKNHYKKKLVDAKMFSMKENGWVEFDIKNAVKAWLNERKPNYGLVIEVENENQDVLDPRNYFRSTPCFKSSSSSDGARDNDDTQGGTGKDDNGMSPMIEICTLNVPETTTSYEHTKFFPFPMNTNSLNHLQRVAESHAKPSNANGTSSPQPRFPWSHNNINLRPEDFGIVDPNANRNSNNNNNDRSDLPRHTIVVPNHRHRHHHHVVPQNDSNNDNIQRSEQTGENRRHQRNRARSNGNNAQQFTLDEDHPLRHILASVNANSKESTKRAQSESNDNKGFPSHLVHEMPADEGRVEADYSDSTEHDRDVFITKIIISPAQLKQGALNGLANRRGYVPFASSMATSSSVVPPTVSTVDSSER